MHIIIIAPGPGIPFPPYKKHFLGCSVQQSLLCPHIDISGSHLCFGIRVPVSQITPSNNQRDLTTIQI